jgi:hypothetical protein
MGRRFFLAMFVFARNQQFFHAFSVKKKIIDSQTGGGYLLPLRGEETADCRLPTAPALTSDI